MIATLARIAALFVLAISPLAAQTDRNPPANGRATDTAPLPALSAGPEQWDVSGRVKCSVGEPTFSRTCGFRLVRNHKEKTTDIFIRNLAKSKASYRVLRYANQSFTTGGNSSVAVQRRGEAWQVSVDSTEFYLIPERLIASE